MIIQHPQRVEIEGKASGWASPRPSSKKKRGGNAVPTDDRAHPENSVAFGAPRIEPRWTASAKEGVGTAYHTSCRLWFTLSYGIVNAFGSVTSAGKARTGK